MNFSDLHQLIHSLNETELQQVEESFDDKSSNYYLLYDHVATQPSPYSDNLRMVFCEYQGISEGSARTYRGRYLEQISNQLLILDAKQSLYTQLQQRLTKAKIFIRKECYNLAEVELKKAAKLEAEIIHPESRWEINSLRARKLFQDEERSIDKELNKYHKVMKTAAADFQQQVDINLIYQSLFCHGMRKAGNEEKWQKIIDKIAKIPFPEKADIETRVDYIAICIRIAYYQKDASAALNWAQKGYKIFEDQPEYKTVHVRYYITILDHYLSGVAQQRKFDKMRELITILKQTKTSEPLLESKKQAAIVFHTLNILCFDEDTRDQLTLQVAEDLRVIYEEYSERFLPARRIATNYLFCHIYLVLLNYGLAEYFAELFDIHVKNKKRPNLQRTVLLIRAFLHVEKGHKNSNSVIQKTKNRLYNWGNVLPYEVVVINHLKRLVDCPPVRRERHDVYRSFQEKLLKAKESKTERMHSGAMLFEQLLAAVLRNKLA